MKAIRLAVILLLTGSIFSNCSRNEISGRVVDAFDNPINGAAVNISGTEFRDVTNGDGRFSLDYAPGNNIEIKVERDGFIRFSMSKSITEKASLELNEIVLYPQFAHEYFFYVNKKSKKYDTLRMREVLKTENVKERALTFIVQETYSIYLPENPTPENPIGKILIPTLQVDTSNIFVAPGKGFILVQCGGEGPNAEVLMRNVRSGPLGFYVSDYKDHMSIVESEVLAVGEKNWTAIMHTDKLTKGTLYAWVKYNKKQAQPVTKGYFFYVE